MLLRGQSVRPAARFCRTLCSGVMTSRSDIPFSAAVTRALLELSPASTRGRLAPSWPTGQSGEVASLVVFPVKPAASLTHAAAAASGSGLPGSGPGSTGVVWVGWWFTRIKSRSCAEEQRSPSCLQPHWVGIATSTLHQFRISESLGAEFLHPPLSLSF